MGNLEGFQLAHFISKINIVVWKDGSSMKFAFLGLYVLIMVAIALYSMKRVNSIQDFFLGYVTWARGCLPLPMVPLTFLQ
jgi:hypothetical protein